MLGKISSTPLKLCFRGFSFAFIFHPLFLTISHTAMLQGQSSNFLAENQGFILQESGIPRLTRQTQTYYAASLGAQAIITRQQIFPQIPCRSSVVLLWLGPLFQRALSALVSAPSRPPLKFRLWGVFFCPPQRLTKTSILANFCPG